MITRYEASLYVTQRIEWDKAVVAMPHDCPNCGERHQVQIRDTMDEGGPLWKCRMCRHRFHSEAPTNVPRP